MPNIYTGRIMRVHRGRLVYTDPPEDVLHLINGSPLLTRLVARSRLRFCRVARVMELRNGTVSEQVMWPSMFMVDQYTGEVFWWYGIVEMRHLLREWSFLGETELD